MRHPQNFGLAAEFRKAPFQERGVRKPFLKMDARLAWLPLVILLISLPFVKAADIWILVAAGAAAFACLLAVAAVDYSPTSFVAIVAVTHLIFYPLAAWGNLLLPEPAVRWDLWVDTGLAMWGCMVGVLALALGAWLAKAVHTAKKSSESGVLGRPTQLKFNVFLVSLLIPGVLIMRALGIFYHSAVTEYNLGSTAYVNLVSILLNISLCGIFLQVYQYTRSHSVRDLCWAALLCLAPVIVFLPSGMRGTALGFLPLLILAFWKWETDSRRKILALAAVLAILFPVTAGMGFYRGEAGIAQLTYEQKMHAALEATVRQGEAPSGALTAIVSRFSDYVATGRIIADTPKIIPYRGAAGMADWWQIYVPGFLNILPHRIDLGDSIEICDRYGITHSQNRASSAPAMIIGDLFSRWGWAGVILGMMALGFILRLLDLRVFNRWTTFTIIFYVMFGRSVVSLVNVTLLAVFLDLARELAAMALVSYLLACIARAFFKGGTVTGEAPQRPRRIA